MAADGISILFCSVEAIIKIARAITEAVTTVRQNEDDCQEIAQCVVSVSAVLNGIYESTPVMAMVPVMRGALDDLKLSLERALGLVRECQQEKHIFLRLFGARDMAAELRRVHDDITRKVTLGILAAHVQTNIRLNNMQWASSPLHPHPAGATAWSWNPNPTPLWTRPVSYVVPEPTPWPRPAPSQQLASWQKQPSMADYCCPSNWPR